MVQAALNQSLGKGLPTSLALPKLVHGLYKGSGVAAAKVQIRWWSELEGVSASRRCSSFNLNCVYGDDSYISWNGEVGKSGTVTSPSLVE